MSYNIDEGIGDNHYNCPVVAYYPELLAANVPALKKTKFLDPYVGLCRHKDFAKTACRAILHREFGIPKQETSRRGPRRPTTPTTPTWRTSSRTGAGVHRARPGRRASPSSCMAGRPYHIDPEINHGINDLITSFGFVLVTRGRRLAYREGYEPRHVLNQWTYPEPGCTTPPDMSAPSRTCSWSSWSPSAAAPTPSPPTSCAPSWRTGGKLYTQLKIDDITNLGAVKIRIRSLMAAMDAGTPRRKPHRKAGNVNGEACL